MRSAPARRSAWLGACVAIALFGLSVAGPALATHEVPQSADSIHVSLVPVFKQCGTGSNSTDGQHSPPLGGPSCLPPTPQSNGARFGPNTVGSANYTVLPGDIQVQLSINDVQTPTGADYNPSPSGRDMIAIVRHRLSDHWNCSGSPESCPGPFDKPGTGADLDFIDTNSIDCIPNGDPATPPGSDCNLNTTWNAELPGSLVPGKSAVLQAFRVRLDDAAFVLFAQQGIYIP